MPAPTPRRARRALLLALLLAAPAAAQPARERDPGPEVTRLALTDATVADAARLVAEVAGWNVVCTPEAGALPVSLLVQRVPVRAALDTLCKVAGLWYREDAGIVRIMTAEQYRDDVVVRREPRVRVFTLLQPNATAVGQAVRDLFGDRVSLTYGVNDQFTLSQLLGGFGTVGGANGTGGVNAVGSVLNGVSGGGFSTSFGGGFNNTFGFGGVVTGTGGTGGSGGALERAAERLDAARVTAGRLSQLQERDGAISGAEADDLTEGLPPIYVTINRRNNLVAVRTSDDDALAEIERLIVELDRPTPQVLLEVKILEVTLNDGQQTAVDFSWLEDPPRVNHPDGQPANPLSPTSALGLTNVLGAGNLPLLGGSLVYQYLNDHIRVRLQALGQEGRLATLATPLLLCANSEVATVFIGEERPIVRNFQVQTVTTNGVVQNQVVPEIELRDVGNTVRMVPFINADRTVLLSLIQDVSSINPGAAQIPAPTGTGGVQLIDIDTVNTANVRGTVSAKDGLTLVVGGLIRKEMSDTRSGIPYLMDLPLVGWLFGAEERVERHKELVLLITPHVLTTPEEGQERTRRRLEELSLHPYHDLGDAALNRYDRGDVPGGADYRLLLEDHLLGAPEPIR